MILYFSDAALAVTTDADLLTQCRLLGGMASIF